MMHIALRRWYFFVIQKIVCHKEALGYMDDNAPSSRQFE
jgi:hypothetical protein